MTHLLKRTKKSCIKFIRKLSNKQIFLKRLEEEDICDDIDLSIEAKEKDINHNENVSTENLGSCYGKQRKVETKPPTSNDDTTSKETKTKRKLSIHFEEVNTDKAVLQSLTSKLFLTADGYEFRRLQQLRSDTSSEIVPYEGHCDKHKEVLSSAAGEASASASASASAAVSSSFNDEAKLEVVFEKVKYKEDVRYLRHTPSTCSLDNYIINDNDDDDGDGDGDGDDDNDVGHGEDENELRMTTMLNTNINNNHNNTLHYLDNGKDFDYTTNTNSGLELHHNHFGISNAAQCDLSQEQDYQQTQLQHQQQQYSAHSQLLNNSLPLNVSLGCIADGSYHQLFIGEERDYFYKLTPVVKWDINGNSLEDDDFPEFGINVNSSPAKSSLRSSSTTLETWLEVE